MRLWIATYYLSIIFFQNQALGDKRPNCLPENFKRNILKRENIQQLLDYNSTHTPKIIPLPEDENYRLGLQKSQKLKYLCVHFYSLFRTNPSDTSIGLDFSLENNQEQISEENCFEFFRDPSEESRFLEFLNSFLSNQKQQIGIVEALGYIANVLDVYQANMLNQSGGRSHWPYCIKGGGRNGRVRTSYTAIYEGMSEDNIGIPFHFETQETIDLVKVENDDGVLSIYLNEKDRDFFEEYEAGKNEYNNPQNDQLDVLKKKDCDQVLAESMQKILKENHKDLFIRMNELLDLKTYYMTEARKIDHDALEGLINELQDKLEQDSKSVDQLKALLKSYQLPTDFEEYSELLLSDEISAQGLASDALVIQLYLDCQSKPQEICLDEQDLMVQGFLQFMRKQLPENLRNDPMISRPFNLVYRSNHYRGEILGAGQKLSLEQAQSIIAEKQNELIETIDFIQGELSRLANDCYLNNHYDDHQCFSGLLNKQLITLYKDLAPLSAPTSKMHITQWDDYTRKGVEESQEEQVSETSVPGRLGPSGQQCRPKRYSHLEKMLEDLTQFRKTGSDSDFTNLTGSSFAFANQLYHSMCESDLFKSIDFSFCEQWVLIEELELFVQWIGGEDSKLLNSIKSVHKILSEGLTLIDAGKFHLKIDINKIRFLTSYQKYCCGEQASPLVLFSILWGGIDLIAAIELDIFKIAAGISGGPAAQRFTGFLLDKLKDKIKEIRPELDFDSLTQVVFKYKINLKLEAIEQAIKQTKDELKCPQTKFNITCPVETSLSVNYEALLDGERGLKGSAAYLNKSSGDCPIQNGKFTGIKFDLSLLGFDLLDDNIHFEAQLWNYVKEGDLVLRGAF